MKFNIKSDSRRVKKGDIFVAIKTPEGDGHNYIEQAIQNGATKIVAMHGSYSVETEIVEDTRKYLDDYLIKNYKPFIDEMTVIGFTGTNGKSTGVHLIYDALNKLGKPCASIGTIGYFLKEGKVCYLANTSPDICETYELFMDAYDKGYRYLAIEASSHGLELGRLEGINYDYAVFSNLTRDHLDFHKTYENYAAAKRKLFERVKENGKGLVNYDDDYRDYFCLAQNDNLTYGFQGGDYHVTDFRMNLDGSDFTFERKGEKFTTHTNLIGEYNISNLMPIIMILEDLGIPMESILKVVPTLNAPEGRIERIQYGTNNIYIDYAHTPDGLEKVVSTVKRVTKGDTYVVFCCRGNRDIGRRKGMMQAACDLAKVAIVTNDHVFQEDPMHVIHDMLEGLENTNYEIITDRQKAIYRGINLLHENDSLLVLGHGHEAVLINDKHEKMPFVERDIIEEYIKTKCN